MLAPPTITGLAHVVLFELIRTAGPVFFSLVNYFTTARGVIWGMLVFGALALVNARPAARAANNGRKP